MKISRKKVNTLIGPVPLEVLILRFISEKARTFKEIKDHLSFLEKKYPKDPDVRFANDSNLIKFLRKLVHRDIIESQKLPNGKLIYRFPFSDPNFFYLVYTFRHEVNCLFNYYIQRWKHPTLESSLRRGLSWVYPNFVEIQSWKFVSKSNSNQQNRIIREMFLDNAFPFEAIGILRKEKPSESPSSYNDERIRNNILSREDNLKKLFPFEYQICVKAFQTAEQINNLLGKTVTPVAA